MTITPKSLYEFSSHLNVLYVEDDDVLREETTAFFEPFFNILTSASNGKKGLELFNHNPYDLVITDINMPEMDGFEMIRHIHEINPDQKIIAISAYNDADTLLRLIREGISSFILKPIIQQEVINTLYPVCRDARAQQINDELFHTLNQKNEELTSHVKHLQEQLNAISVKHRQVELLLSHCSKQQEENPVLEEYFRTDEDQGREKVLFYPHDCDEILEIMNDGVEVLSLYADDANLLHIEKLGNLIRKMSSILYLYTPFLDPLAKSMEDLALKISESPLRFIESFSSNPELFYSLFDAIKIDMERYVNRFSVESMAMRNIHHIHEPTSMSIRQVIALIDPDNVETGEIEFF